MDKRQNPIFFFFLLLAAFLCGNAWATNNNELVVVYDMDGNVLNIACDFTKPYTRVALKIISVTGGSGNYTITAATEDAIDKTTISEGEGFTYYFSEEDQSGGTISYTIDDGAGNVCALPDDLASQLEIISFTQACGCSNEISAAIKPGEVTYELSCGLDKNGIPAFFVDVLDIFGGLINASYEIKTFGLGEVSSNLLEAPPFRFTYSFNQNDIDANVPLGFEIHDGHTCFFEQTFVPPLALSIAEACDIGCYISGEIENDSDNNIKFDCAVIGDSVLQASLNYNNITGGNGEFIYEANIGTISNAITSEPGSLTYNFTPEDYASGQIDFFMKDTAINCVTHVDINKLVTAFPVEACSICNYSLSLQKNKLGNIDIGCDFRGDENRAVIMVTIQSDNDLPVLITSTVGELSANSVSTGEVFDYRFTSNDLSSEDFGISVGNKFTPCALINFKDELPVDLLKTCIEVSVPNVTILSELTVYPNPAAGIVSIEGIENMKGSTLQLIALNGGQITLPAILSNGNLVNLNVSNVADGVYILKLVTISNGVLNKKLVIAN